MQDFHRIDERLKELFEPQQKAVQRIIVAAMNPGDRRVRHRVRLIQTSIVAAGMLVLAILVARLAFHSTDMPDFPAVGTAGELVLIQNSSGESWIVGPTHFDDWFPAGTGFVIVEGGKK